MAFQLRTWKALHWGLAGCGWLLLAPCPGRAAPAAATPSVQDYEQALTAQHLAPAAARDLDELNGVLEVAQKELLAGRQAQAAEQLVRVTDGPRFGDFADFEEYQNAEYMLAGALLELGAKQSARRYLERLIARGKDGPYYSPAFRRLVDVALASHDPDDLIAVLTASAGDAPDADAAGELAYLRGHLAYLRDDLRAATEELKTVTTRSRFYASAQYLLGAIAAQRGRYVRAEERFCAIAQAGDNHVYRFFVDDRYYPLRDLSHLGLGRVSHEMRRNDDAFYYYFQVPQDSSRLDEALFEAAYSSYEGGKYDAALDALDQLDAKAPRSVFSAEGSLLRGYLHLSRCEFGDAEQHLLAFQKRFTPLVAEIDAILESPERTRSLYADLSARERDRLRIEQEGQTRTPSPDSALLALLRVDPEFYALHAQLRDLDQETARTGRLPDEFASLAASLKRDGTPTRTVDEEATQGQQALALRQRTQLLREGMGAMSAELTRLRRAGAKARELSALRDELRAMNTEATALERALRASALDESAPAPTETPSELVTLLQTDRHATRALLREVAEARDALQARADALGAEGLRALRESLAAQLRRARIGRIDAVMGAKRRLELQVESLAAGRFPPELADPLRMQSLLRDDEEYWPFEGEDWPDEFVEHYPEEDAWE